MATAAITISSTCSGLPQGGLDLASYQMVNTSAAKTEQVLDCATALGSANHVVVPTSGQFAWLIPPATNQTAWRLTASTLEAGIPMDPAGCAFLRVPGGTSVYFYTTVGSTFLMRVLTY